MAKTNFQYEKRQKELEKKRKKEEKMKRKQDKGSEPLGENPNLPPEAEEPAPAPDSVG